MNIFLSLVSVMFGTVPFNRRSQETNFVVDYIWMIVVPIIYLVCYYLANFGEFGIYQLPNCGSICKLGSSLFMHLGCYVYVSVHLLTLLRRKHFYIEFESRLNDIDELIQHCKKIANYKEPAQRNYSLRQLAWVVIVLVFCWDVFYDANNQISYYKTYSFVALMLTTFPFFAASTVQGQFVHYVTLVSQRFDEVNHLFEKINQECDKKNGPVTVFDIETDTVKSSATILSKRRRTVSPKGKPIARLATYGGSSDEDGYSDDGNNIEGRKYSNDGVTSESNLPDLFKLHDKILTLSVLTNGEFGIQCVPYMAVCFVITIFGIFLVTKVNIVVGGINQLLDYVVLMYVCWSITTLMVAYLVLRFCCNTNGHSKQSAMTVHEIMQKKPAFMLGNDLYYNKMKSFTLQFLHWEGYFQFNGIGLFTLDYTFIFSAVSAATSYLIVLLQFDMVAVLKSDGLL